ncbi:hypothetical protein GQ54DRAFT_12427 [Martensiomyces pterosporus]|nr:hypothetical protein GQ54DRAFT_12427 [Martensiomyces pterosporus]
MPPSSFRGEVRLVALVAQTRVTLARARADYRKEKETKNLAATCAVWYARGKTRSKEQQHRKDARQRSKTSAGKAAIERESGINEQKLGKNGEKSRWERDARAVQEPLYLLPSTSLFPSASLPATAEARPCMEAILVFFFLALLPGRGSL